MIRLRLYLLAGITFLATSLRAQGPVTWTYTAKPIGAQIYELHVTASIDPGWHVYSQHQPDNAIAQPTSITYTVNPLITLQGPIKEEGKLIHYKNDQLGVAQDQYSNKVDFVQIVKLKAAVKTRIAGSLTFQTCTDERCLPPASTTFSIDLPPVEGSK